MIELQNSDDGRYVCCLFVASDFEDPDGVEAFTQQNHLMRHETGHLNPDELAEVIEVAKERINAGTHAYIMLWDRHEQRAAGASLVSDILAQDGFATFSASYITESYRGQGLSKILHQGRAKHLQDCGCIGARTTIADFNIPSIKAAERQGFIRTGHTVSEFGIAIGEYTLTISDQEPAPRKDLD